jgi:hypothetical protein
MGWSIDNVRTERLPTGDDSSGSWTIKRASHERPLQLVIVSHDLFGIRTHFWQRRTGPCLKVGCEACAKHQLSRWNGYLLALQVPSNERVIFEFTPAAAVTLDALFKEAGTLRGLKLLAGRAGGKLNGKVQVTSQGFTPNTHKLPADEPVWPVLSRVWGLTDAAQGSFSEFDEFATSESEKVQEGIAPKHTRRSRVVPGSDGGDNLAGQVDATKAPSRIAEVLHNFNGRR